RLSRAAGSGRRRMRQAWKPRWDDVQLRTYALRLSPLLRDRFELGDALQVLGATGCSLDMDQSLEIHEPNIETEQQSSLGARQQRFVRAAAGCFAHGVEISSN